MLKTLTDAELDAKFAFAEELDFVGKGRKKCPSCKEIIGARTIICKCSYSFKDGTTGNEKPAPPVSKVYSSPGKGKKQCFSCKKYVGARAMECPNCGVDLSQKAIKEREANASPLEKLQKATGEMSEEERLFLLRSGYTTGDVTVYGPSGDCPLKLQRTDKEAVFDWCDFILSDGKDRNYIYMPQAMKYWARFFYPIGTEEYTTVTIHINSWVQEIIGQDELESNL